MGKKIDISTQEGLDALKIKAKFYGYYADNLMVKELIQEIEYLRANTPESIAMALCKMKEKLGW